MARRLTFAEFQAALEQRRITLDTLSDYLEFDPDSPIPMLRFRPDALVDRPPAEYDVDRHTYVMLRSRKREQATQLKTVTIAARKRVVAEGDSWFNLPQFIRPPAIADWIEWNGTFDIDNIAYWGHTLKRILQEREYIGAIEEAKPDYFIFSAGGNDLQEGLAAGRYIHPYEPSRPADMYLTAEGGLAMSEIGDGYRRLSAELLTCFPTVRVIYHGYDYPRPLVSGGTYIGKYLRKQGIPDNLMGPIMASVLDKLGDAIRNATEPAANVFYLDCRRKTEPYTWYDDMHPGRDGFQALARMFEAEMTHQ